ncbi:calcium/hydrogen antiporter NDAI_0G01500 [Naumovozyma dairenensis CBS 421]|uniref:Sodium/calcium exchanger membrane region domain-containing protein n=1 Tax=Naumovozyma dairenensis (strain ATCC 10597 / BCRC 20456 / CBS 421 / NBRC 0211 / NRRL Y-12639) TaxID=1071378 RepID=G0WDR5_NAUDC|nr:hypothetical protein NDAI_0G01500 [Naumovozyma dairenensis CBS 421]CCD25926.2 hypothetical protein NDAI_0G01500 [Naumovozyma dairenensis CBS 421]
MSREPDHVRRVFSVDDDPHEVENDVRYLEGLHDGLKYALQNKSITPQSPAVEITSQSKNSSAPDLLSPAISNHSQHLKLKKKLIIKYNYNHLTAHSPTTITTRPSNFLKKKNSSRLSTLNSPKIRSNNTVGADYFTNKHNHIHDHTDFSEESRDRFIIHNPPHNNTGHDLLIEELDPADAYNPDNDNNNDDMDEDIEDRISMASSLESFTLRERQDAINKTHPFGIRIWKPALYKKKRSVQKAADEDIHETQLKMITWPVHISNIIWSFTVGLFLASLFSLGGIIVAILGLFTKSAREYSIVCFRLARYLFLPFGKVVYLIADEHYLEEDNQEGISVNQFYKWVTSYSNRLFFHESQANNNSLNDNTHPSYGSIHNFMTHQSKRLPTLPARAGDRQSSSSSTPMIPHANSQVTTNLPAPLPNNPESQNQINSTSSQRRFFGRGKWTCGRLIFYFCFHLFLQPFVLIFALLSWLFVFTIPMSNILWNLMYHCRKHPLALGFKNIKNSNANSNPIIKIYNNGSSDDSLANNKSILLCTFRCAGWHYYKFTVDGTNIIVVNLIAIVFFTIFDFYLLKNSWHFRFWFTDESTIFMLCLTSIIPLAFYIGQAVASISAQTSMGVGAVINAFFSTIVEIFLYCVALQQRKGPLVEGSMIGSILGAVLLLPGLSMCGGAWNRKTQRYNPASAGVSSALLIFSMLVMFVPTILYDVYGGYIVKCEDGFEQPISLKTVMMPLATSSNCSFYHPPLEFDRMYTNVIQPMSVSCAIVLFLAYTIGLWFTLRTHAAMIWHLPISDPQKETPINVGINSEQNSILLQHPNEIAAHTEPNSGGHDAPNWSRTKSTWILLVATLLYAVIAEILVACVDSVLEDFPSLNPKFLGLTIFALVPNTTEFLNAISFAIHGNVALSMEIGSAYALQVCLLQIPALVIYSIWYTWSWDRSMINIREQMFSMIFPRWDLIASMGSVFLFTYLYAEGKSNYFKGSMLILLYVIVILGFFFQDVLTNWKWE